MTGRGGITHRTIRVQRKGGTDAWLTNQGDSVQLVVPGGRVTLELSGGWSESGIAFARLSYEPIRSGLMRFARG